MFCLPILLQVAIQIFSFHPIIWLPRLFIFDLWRSQRKMNLSWSCMFLLLEFSVFYKMFIMLDYTILLSHTTFFSRSKLFSYDEVVQSVAQHLNVNDPSKIRLTSHNCYSQQPKPQPIKYRGVDHLMEMLVHYNQVK